MSSILIGPGILSLLLLSLEAGTVWVQAFSSRVLLLNNWRKFRVSKNSNLSTWHRGGIIVSVSVIAVAVVVADAAAVVAAAAVVVAALAETSLLKLLLLNLLLLPGSGKLLSLFGLLVGLAWKWSNQFHNLKSNKNFLFGDFGANDRKFCILTVAVKRKNLKCPIVETR